MPRPRKVLVCGRDDRSFLTVIRSLGRAGIEVHIAQHQPSSVATSSRYVSAQHELTLPDTDEPRWLEEFSALLKQERVDLVIPCHDENIIPVLNHRDRLEEIAKFALPSAEALRVCMSKARTWDLAKSLGISVPKQVALSSVPEIEIAIETTTFPSFLKPVASHVPGSGRQGVEKVSAPGEFRALATAMLRQSPTVLVQEHVPGVGVGVEVLSFEGKILFALQHERLHESQTGGGCYRRTRPLHPELLNAAELLIQELEYTGVGMFEFKFDHASGSWALIEINSRFWGSLPLAVSAGADYPYWLYQMLVDGKREFKSDYNTNVFSRYATGDIAWLRNRVRTVHGTRDLAGFSATMIREAANVFTLRERIDTFSFDDPKPAIREIWEIGGRALAPLRATVSGFAGRIDRSVHSGDRRNRFRQAKNVLFVCKGNICRSPFAELYSRKHRIGGKNFCSAGYYPVAERPSPAAAVCAAAEFDVDLEGHRSQVLTGDLIASADLVLLFDDENRRTVFAQFPEARERSILLGDLAGSGPQQITDPYGRGTEFFVQIYKQISSVLEEIEGSAR